MRVKERQSARRRGTNERESEKRRAEDARMGAALFKRGWGCQIELPPRTTAPRGRLPGRWRSRATSGRHGVASVSLCLCARARTCACAETL